MRSHYLQKGQIIICLLISVYLSELNVDASAVKDKDISDRTAYQQQGDINSNDPYHANFKCPSKFGAFPDVTDCGKFYICVMGFARRMPCPPFHHFDKNRRRCMSILVAVCDDGEEEKETTIIGGTETDDEKESTVEEFVCPDISGEFPHPTDCSQYYTCTSYEPSLKTCPEKELFDGIKKECRPESEVNCGSRIRPTVSDEPTLATTPVLPEYTPDEVSTPEEVTPEPTTPTEEEPTPPDHDCDEDDLDCIITETGEIPKWFKCPVDIGSYRHPSSRKLFIFCINWKPYVKKCGKGLVYLQDVRTCVEEFSD